MLTWLENNKKRLGRFIFRLALIWRGFRQKYFYFSIKEGKFRLHINDRYEVAVKWILRILTAIGIISSVLTIPWPFNLISALVLLGIDQVLEKAVFVFNAFYVSAMPNYEPKDWLGMAWGYSYSASTQYFEIGMIFSSKKSAEKIFPIIKHWSKDER